MEAIVDTSRPTIRFEHDGRTVEIVFFGDKIELYREYKDARGLMQFCGYVAPAEEGGVQIRNARTRAAIETAVCALRAMVAQHRAKKQAAVDAEVALGNVHLALGRAQEGCDCYVCDLFRRGAIKPERCR